MVYRSMEGARLHNGESLLFKEGLFLGFENRLWNKYNKSKLREVRGWTKEGGFD